MPTLVRDDPYVQWAIATDFAHLNLAHARLLVESKVSVAALAALLHQEKALSNLHLPAAYLHPAMQPARNRFCTLDIVPNANLGENAKSILTELFSGSSPRAKKFWSAVERAECAASVAPQARGVPIAQKPAAQYKPFPSIISPKNDVLEHTFLGVIDVGLPILRSDWRGQLLRVWDQTLIAPEPSERVAGFGYGREFSPSKLTNFDQPATAAQWYAEHQFAPSLRAFTHGGAVATKLAEKSAGLPMLAVQIGQPILAHSSRVALSAQLLDALAWMVVQADLANAKNKLVVNVSLGTQAGPHDGSAIFERALDQLISQNKVGAADRLAVVFAAGNTYEARCHAEINVTRAKSATLKWNVPPDSVAPHFVELWFPPGTAQASVRLTAPDGRTLPAVAFGSAATLADDEGTVIARVSGLRAGTSSGGADAMALISLAPSYASGTAGIWKITVASPGTISGIHAYIERANSMFDPAAPLGRQSRFVDAAYVNGATSPVTLLDHAGTPIKRLGTLSTFATSAHAVVVGASAGNTSRSRHSRYSSAGPTRGVRVGDIPQDFRPDAVTAGDESAWFAGVRVRGTQALSVGRAVGTSFAAPVVARAIALAMRSGTMNTSARKWVQQHVKSDPTLYQPGKTSNPHTGAGVF